MYTTFYYGELKVLSVKPMLLKKIPLKIKDYPANSILIIGLSSLGDNLLLTPAIKLIRETYKKAQFDIIVGSRATEFARGNPWFSEIFVLNKKKGFFRLLRRLRRKKYDLIFDFRNSLLPFFLRGRYKFTFFLHEFLSDKTYTHESERVLHFLEPYFGKVQDVQIYFPVSQSDKERMEKLLKSLGIKKSDAIIILNPGAAFPKKRWKMENFIETARQLLKEYDAKIIVIGGMNEKGLAERIAGAVKSKDIFDFSGKTTLGELAALFQMSDLLITNDTGPMHLAAAVKCPVVAVFGPGNPYRYGPLGTKSYVLHTSLDCFPCKLEAKCRKKFVCMEHVSVEDVIKAVSLILDEGKQLHLFDIE